MPVLARDVRDRSFKTVLGGFDTDAVRTAVETAAAAFDRIEAESAGLQQQQAATVREIERIEDLERSLLRACVAAEEDARIRCGAARRYATRIIASAEEQASVLLEAPTRERDRIARDLEAIRERRRHVADVLERLVAELQRPRDAETPRETAQSERPDKDAQAGVSRDASNAPLWSPTRGVEIPPPVETAVRDDVPAAAAQPTTTRPVTPDATVAVVASVRANDEAAGRAAAPADRAQKGPSLGAAVGTSTDSTPVDGDTAPADRSRRIRVPVAAGAAAAVLLLLQGSAGVTQPDGMPVTATATLGPAGQPAVDRATAADPGDGAPATDPLASAAAGVQSTATAAPLTLRLRPLRVCWVRVVVDDRTDARELQPGEEIRLEARRAILLHVGDAGALSVELNGRVLPPLGRDGQVVERRFTPPPAE
jgi:cell division septum initiation protein DivIVA